MRSLLLDTWRDGGKRSLLEDTEDEKEHYVESKTPKYQKDNGIIIWQL